MLWRVSVDPDVKSKKTERAKSSLALDEERQQSVRNCADHILGTAEAAAIHIAIHNNVFYDVLPMIYSAVRASQVLKTLAVTQEVAGSSPSLPPQYQLKWRSLAASPCLDSINPFFCNDGDHDQCSDWIGPPPS